MPTQFHAQDETVCYARLSMQREDPTSIDRQVALTTQEAIKRGTRPVVFAEEKGHRSGRSEKNRPKFREAKEYVERHRDRVKYFAVQDKDRVSRKALHRLGFFEWLKAMGVEFISILDPEMTGMPDSSRNLMETTLAGVSQHYADFIAEKMKNHVRYVKDHGGKWGRAPQGFKLSGKGVELRWAPVGEDAFRSIILILEVYTKHHIGAFETARQANILGARWIDRWGQPRQVAPGDVRKLITTLDYYEGYIDPALLARAKERQRQRGNRRENGRMNQHSQPLVLWRLVYCAECGVRFSSSRQMKRWRYNRKTGERSEAHSQWARAYYLHLREFNSTCSQCGRSIPAEELEAQVWSDLTEFFVLSDKQKERIAKLVEKPTVTNPGALQRQKLERRLRNLEIRYLDDEISKPEYLAIRAEIMSDLAKLPQTLEPIQITLDDAFERLGSVVSLVRSHAGRDPEEVNSILRAIIECVYVQGNTVVGYKTRSWSTPMFPPDKLLERETRVVSYRNEAKDD